MNKGSVYDLKCNLTKTEDCGKKRNIEKPKEPEVGMTFTKRSIVFGLIFWLVILIGYIVYRIILYRLK